MDRLKNKVALITGGTSGIGAATASLFQAEGAQVIATGSSATSVATARARSPEVNFVQSDAGDPEATRQLVEQVRRDHGRLDILFVNAGIARLKAIETMDKSRPGSPFLVDCAPSQGDVVRPGFQIGW